MKKVIKVRWVDRDKGTGCAPNVRSRLVAKEFATSIREDIYAPTPSLEAVKVLLSTLACNKGQRLGVLDVSKAFLYADAEEDIWIEVPVEDPRSGPGVVAKLNKSMYGTRNAPRAWYRCVCNVLIEMGFQQGRSNACLYFHPDRNIRLLVHVDDFAYIGHACDINWFVGEMKKVFKVIAITLGPDHGEVNEVKFLNRVIRWEQERGYLQCRLAARTRHHSTIWPRRLQTSRFARHHWRWSSTWRRLRRFRRSASHSLPSSGSQTELSESGQGRFGVCFKVHSAKNGSSEI